MREYATAKRLGDRDRLRAMYLALQGDPERFVRVTDVDHSLVEPVQRPFDSITEADTQLRRLETRLHERGDRRAVFLSVYTAITRGVQNGIWNGTFSNPDWMRTYTVTFANYYRRAFLAFERGNLGAVPDPWRIAFGTAVRGDGLIGQDVLLGVNAHINYDLALALCDVGIDSDRSGKHDDHRKINDILARILDALQEKLAEVYAPGIAEFDATLGGLDEAFAMFTVTESRAHAWRFAVVLTDATWPPLRSMARWVLRATATGGAFFIRSPSMDPTLFEALERVETEGIELDGVLEEIRDRVVQPEIID